MVIIYYVYIHTTPDGKKYVGQTKNPIHRWNNGDGYSSNKAFYDAIIEYGWNNIKHEIVGIYNSEYESKICEAVLVFYLQTENPKLGYNNTNIRESTLSAYVSRVEVDNMDFEHGAASKNVFEESGLPICACKALIDEWIFDKKNREIVKDKLIDGMSYVELSKKYKMSVRQLKYIVSDCTKRIQERI